MHLGWLHNLRQLMVNTKVILKFKKLIIQTKHIVFLQILILLIFPSTLCAFDEKTQPEAPTNIEQKTTEEISVFKKGCNVVYQFVNNHEYLFAPLSGAIAGGVVCGPWCFSAGGIVGAIDEISIYFGFTDRRYLTWGVFGLATGNTIKPSLVFDIVGVAVGILLPTGILNRHSELIAPIASTIAGGSRSGYLGLISGGAAGIYDELAVHNGDSDKHYMTFCNVGMAATNLLGWFNPAVADFIGMILGSIAAEYEDKLSAILMAPVKTTANLYNTYGKFIPKDQLDSNIEKQALALIGTQFLVQFLDLKIIGHEQSVEYNFQRLNVPNGLAWRGFTSELTNFAIFLFPYLVGQTVSDRINSYFNKKTQHFLEDKIRSELFSGETASRLSDDHSTKVLTDNLKGDIATITKTGSGLITGAVSTSISGVYGVGVIIVHSPNILVYSFLYSQAQSFILNYLAAEQSFYKEKITGLDSEIKSIMQHDAENIRVIAERDGMDATKTRLQQLYSVSREYESSQELWDSASRLWRQVSGVTNYIVNYALVGNEINQGRLPFENRGKAHNAGWQVSNWLSWPGRNAQDVSSIDLSSGRIIVLEGKMHARPEHIDQISRTPKEGSQLIIQDLEVAVGDKILVSVEDLKLEMGKAYAITGKPGCGKTNFLFKIKGVKSSGVSGKGHIHYPLVNGKEPKIVMVSQQDYFPINSSLQNIISYPDEMPNDPIINNKKKEQIRLLLKEIELWESDVGSEKDENKNEDNKKLDLDSIKNWFTVLSGGQKKKIMLVSALIKNPNILILDETFDSLGSSTIVVQQMLKKHLPNALILVVDHYAQSNNYNHFYDKELNFSNKSIVFKEMLSKRSEEY